VDGDGFISCCSELKYLGSTLVPKLRDTAAIIKQISQAGKVFDTMHQHIFHNKRIRKEIRRNFYPVIVAELAAWGCKSCPLKDEDRGKCAT
jgi:hypothetical protein